MKGGQFYDNFNPESLSEMVGNLERDRFMEAREYTRPEYVLEFSSGHGSICYGETMLLTGKVKAGKSYFLNMIRSAFLKKTGRYENIICNIHPEGSGSDLDTEMSRNKHSERMSLAAKAAGLDRLPQNYYSIPIAMYSDPAAKIQYFIKLCEEFGSDIVLVIKDKVADFVRSSMKEDQAEAVISKFRSLQAKYNYAEIVTLHQNRGDANSNGTIGVITDRWATDIKRIRLQDIEDEKSPMVIDTQFHRDGQYCDFLVRIDDETKLPVLVERQRYY